MLNRLMSIFKRKEKQGATLISVRDMSQDISVFYEGKILTPNVDYHVLYTEDRISRIKINKTLNKNKLEVLKIYLPYKSTRPIIRPWGFKNFKHA